MSGFRVADTHAHLDDPRFDADLEAVLERAAKAGVATILTVGTDAETSRRGVEIARARRGVFAAVGFHPHEADRFDDAAEAVLRGLTAEARVVAIGEIGLDYFKDYAPRPAQRAAFERQAALAAESGLPIVLHNRDATEDCLAVLAPHRGRLRGVAHCFSGDADAARRFLDLGLFVSFAGNVTYRRAGALQEAVRSVPEDRLLLETDCPYLAPQGRRGARNEPAFILETLRAVAALRGVAPEGLAEATTRNARALFARMAGVL